MADIYQDFPINSSVEKVFGAISTAAGLDQWWTKRSAGQPILGQEYELWFGPEYDWRATVTKCLIDKEFELTMTHSDADWAVHGLDFNWSRAQIWFGFDFIIAAG